MNPNKEQHLINRLKQHPKLLERMEALLNVVENSAGDYIKADDTEQYVIEELRKMGNDALYCWSGNAVIKTASHVREQQPELHGNGKKNSAGTRPSVKYRTQSSYFAARTTD